MTATMWSTKGTTEANCHSYCQCWDPALPCQVHIDTTAVLFQTACAVFHVELLLRMHTEGGC